MNANQRPDWKNAINNLRDYVVRISTPQGSGTGFLFAESQGLCGVATAAHVVGHAHQWEMPIRLDHYAGRQNTVLRHGQRAVLLDPVLDSAAIVFPRDRFLFPAGPPRLIEAESTLRIGNSVGWLGFPAISPSNLCFFKGTTSCWLPDEHSYLVDGVAINGVSGGPAFWSEGADPVIVGAVTAYIPNRATGDVLPGLSVVRDLKHTQQVVQQLRSLEEAQERQGETQAERAPAGDSGGPS